MTHKGDSTDQRFRVLLDESIQTDRQKIYKKLMKQVIRRKQTSRIPALHWAYTVAVLDSFAFTRWRVCVDAAAAGRKTRLAIIP